MRVAVTVPGEDKPRSASHELTASLPHAGSLAVMGVRDPHIYRDGGLTIDVVSEPMAHGLQAVTQSLPGLDQILDHLADSGFDRHLTHSPGFSGRAVEHHTDSLPR
jgi:hypothetical protein